MHPMRAQLKTLAGQAAGQREDWFGVPGRYGEIPVTASAAQRRTTKKLEESGFELAHDSIIRVNRERNKAFHPELGKLIVIDSEEFRIAEIIDHPTNPEWRIGLSCPN